MIGHGRQILVTVGRDPEKKVASGVNGGFTEGFDTPDLKEAKALLDELG